MSAASDIAPPRDAPASTGPAASPSPAGGRTRRWLRTARYYIPAIAVFLAGIVLWELAVGAMQLQAFILPKPSAILAALQANWGDGRFALLPSAQATLIEAVGGMVIGTVGGVLVAFVTARWVTVRAALLPFAIAAGAIPIIAIAPLMNNWFGVLSPLSKMMMAAVLVFFPVMVNVTRGLVLVEPSALELMRSYAASESTVLRKVRIPNALPFFFTALKLGATLSLIGAIVGEYFGGASLVLGRIIVQSASALRFDVTWAAILFGAATGIAFYVAISLVERVVIPWHASVRATE
ncbi:MAG TPA: ABC transporter permease [Candidatus Limnocylindrales bacterium]|nr:ABC transporter permease [Candidatus Limnocylindrales bacterium]